MGSAGAGSYSKRMWMLLESRILGVDFITPTCALLAIISRHFQHSLVTYASAASSSWRQHRLHCTPANGHAVAAPAAAYVSVGTVLGHIAYPPPDVPHSSMLAEGCHCKLLGGAGSCRAATCMTQQQGRHTAHHTLRLLVVYMLQCHLNSHWWVSHQVSQHMPQHSAHRCICHLAAATSVIQMLSIH